MRNLFFTMIIFVFSAPASGSQSYDFLKNKNWGIQNRGVPQNMDLDRMYTYKSQASEHEDIQWVPPNSPVHRKVRVAILDTGIDLSHPYLQPFLFSNSSECVAYERYKACLAEKSKEICDSEVKELIDHDGNGYPLDCHGWSTVQNQTLEKGKVLGGPVVNDPVGHGTHVAGIIAQVSPHVEIIPVQVLGSNPNSPTRPASLNPTDLIDGPVDEKNFSELPPFLSNILIRGLLYAIKSGAEVINLSMGWTWEQDSATTRALIEEVLRRGILIVAASGNDSTQSLIYPCAYSGVICVGSHNPDGSISHFSNYSSGVDLLAPGLNILSTFPLSLRSKSFRGEPGFEFLSGSSQGTPFVTGVIAEMISRGVPKTEIYPRLILGSRKVKPALNLLSGAPHFQSEYLLSGPKVEKATLGGNLDMKGALLTQEQPLIVPYEKSPHTILWNGKDRELFWKIKLVNLWKAFSAKDLKISAKWKSPLFETLHPHLAQILPEQKDADIWEHGEVRAFDLKLLIVDSPVPSETRIASDLELNLYLSNEGQKLHFEFPVRASIIYQISPQEPPAIAQLLTASQNLPTSRPPLVEIEYLPFHRVHDDNRERRDYLLRSTKKGKTTYQLLKQETQSQYDLSPAFKIPLKEKEENYTISYLERMDRNQDHISEYLIGFKSLNRNMNSRHWVEFFFFDSATNLLERFEFEFEHAPLPSQLYWLKTGSTLKPAWVGPGFDPMEKPNLWSLWEAENSRRVKNRFFYFDESENLRALTQFRKYDVMDVINPSYSSTDGKLLLLFAQNRGSDLKPSYHSQYAIGTMGPNGIETFDELSNLNSELGAKKYQNILERSKGLIYNLDLTDSETTGTYWSADSLPKAQDILALNVEVRQWFQGLIEPLRAPFDAVLAVKSVFWGKKTRSAFGVTLTEIQFVDFSTKEILNRSLERYTFYPTGGFNKVLFSTMVHDTKRNIRLPALYVTEDSRITLGSKLILPAYENGKLLDLIQPAKLRISTENRCESFPQPIFLGASGAYALDYLCDGKILRIPLQY